MSAARPRVAVLLSGGGRTLENLAEVVARGELRASALELAGKIAAKSPTIVRLAKEALNGVEEGDLERHYRWEQGFTAQAYLTGESQEARDAFVEKRDARFDNTKQD